MLGKVRVATVCCLHMSVMAQHLKSKTTGACFMRESDRRRGICDKKMYFNKTNKCEANMSQRESHEGALTAQ